MIILLNIMNVEDIYIEQSPYEHILSESDMYIGNIYPDRKKMYILENNKFILKDILISDGLYKIFDEILVNARDQTILDDKCNLIKVNINNSYIEIFNNGIGIPIEIHSKFNIYVPEMIFGRLRTSSNYNRKGKITGGKNGFGAKLTNIFSNNFYIETINNNKLYIQKFSNNMKNISPPIIKECFEDSYTKIKFEPDLRKFHLKTLSDDILNLFKKRVYDIAGCVKNTTIYLNDTKININNFKNYVEKYATNDIYYQSNDRWDVCLEYNKNSTVKHICFVNGILSSGTNMSYIIRQCSSILEKVLDKKIRVDILKSCLNIYINSIIIDPIFTSQSKDVLRTHPSKFGSSITINKNFYESLPGLVEHLNNYLNMKNIRLLEKNDKKKNSNLLYDIPNFDDALLAGSNEYQKTSLIIVEGLSAKAFITTAITNKIIDNKYYGIYPIRGKLINVRSANFEKILHNKIFNNIKNILGLSVKSQNRKLRYGNIIILTDQDNDGYHIKGLIINMIHFYWPNLVLKNNFIKFLKTPLIKVFYKKNIFDFYSIPEYEKWRKINNYKNIVTKYYKGLGSSNKEEILQVLRKFNENIIILQNRNDDDTDNSLNLAFNKNYADDRKKWLLSYDKNSILENDSDVTISDFINKELIHFSNSDNIRSLPSIIDGFKISHRKIFYGCLKKNIINDIKITSLAGYISENTDYHHGEASLLSSIIHMAQDFPGSNNINYLIPEGVFGTRRALGKDHAQPRYIKTKLNKIVRYIFREEDDQILDFNYDDNQKIEPKYYLPIIPTILINKIKGIGTGYSTYIPSFNVYEIIDYIFCKLDNKKYNKKFIPYFKDFEGVVKEDENSEKSFRMECSYIQKGSTIYINEIPLYISSTKYEEYLNMLLKDKYIEKYYPIFKNEKTVSYEIKLENDFLKNINRNDLKISNILKLTYKFSITNMYMYNFNNKLRLYDSVEDIIDDFYNHRIKYFEIRKKKILNNLLFEIEKESSKKKYIQDIINKNLIIDKKSKNDIIEYLNSNDYIKINNSFNYLLDMRIISMSRDNIKDLDMKIDKLTKKYSNFSKKTIVQIWKNDLNELLEKLKEYNY